MGVRRVGLLAVLGIAVATVAACSGDDDDAVAVTATDAGELQEELAAANARADKAEAERDSLAAQLEAAQDQLAHLSDTTVAISVTAPTTPATTDVDTSATTTAATNPPTSAATTGQPAGPDASPYVEAIGDVSTLELPVGDPGEVSVVAVSPSLDRSGSLPVVVRNNTPQPVGPIDVAGTARDSSGALVASGSSQGFKPVVVAPGEVAYGYVYFGDEVPPGASFDLTVSSDAVTDYFMPVLITELSATGDQLIGILMNDASTTVSGPIGVDAICFDANTSAILSTQGSYAEQDELAAGATGSFSIDLFGDQCPRGLISASGYGF